jgi:hypothetical protein
LAKRKRKTASRRSFHDLGKKFKSFAEIAAARAYGRDLDRWRANPPFCDGKHSCLNRDAYGSDQRKRRAKETYRRKTMFGLEVFGLAFLALLSTAAQFCWLLETKA